MLLPTLPSFRPMGMVGEAYQVMLTIRGRLITPFILGSMSEHSDSSFVYGFMSLDYGLGTMTTTSKCIKSPYRVPIQ